MILYKTPVCFPSGAVLEGFREGKGYPVLHMAVSYTHLLLLYRRKKEFFPVHPVWDLCPVLLSAVNEPVHAGLCG